ncbi:hypothetical protein KPL47_09375 [Clostridium estertheticum]|uniref:hypothetical protein n=1 Tax=Clostridium estertheticum TaxID=238834 RepID=UPI001C0D0FFB|nr:hypothetical protein [Clostridium estertheticum]MBU3176584.1 hypothetical protein [Clostridium estertheticum]
MSKDNNINYNEDNDKIQNDNVKEFLNSIANSHSIKDELLKQNSESNSQLENVSGKKSKRDDREDNSDGTYKIINFL